VIRFSVCLDDVPGALSKLLALVASSKANIMHILHHRSAKNIPIYSTIVELEIETRGPAHVKEITDHLNKAGYEIIN
jgi:threonine dehydratase